MQTSPNSAGVARYRVPAALTVLLLLPGVYSDVLATGRPPFARNDSATVARGGTVSVLDSGSDSVLDNDFDIENDPLTAVLVSDVEHGELTLESDGTFNYRHDGSFTGDDIFSYRAFDGTGFSRRVARVRINVLAGDPIPPQGADLELTATVFVNPVVVGEVAQWNINIENQGPADLAEGELVAQWTTSGPAISLSAPQSCALSNNDSRNPTVRCPLDGLAANTSATFNVQGTQDADGDNSLIAIAVSDDPMLENNSALIGAQVVAEFSEGPTQILNLSGADIATGDLNGDGEYDLVVTSEQTVVFFNSGNRTVATPGTSLGPDSGGTTVVVLDWNGDTMLDIAVAGMSDKTGRIYINDGAGGYANDGIDLRISGLGTIAGAAAADFDQDGYSELVLTGSMGTVLVNGSGQTSYSRISLPVGPGIDVSVVDINNDGFADIVLVEAGDRSVNILRNSGNGETYSVQRLQRGSVASATAADLNGDGDADLLLAIDGADLTFPESRILYQRSDGSFSSGDTIGASSLSKMLAGDVDGDSVVDIIALNAAGVHQVYRGKQSGGFALHPEQIVSAGMRRGVLIDFNNDQSLDLIMAGPNASVVEIHANNGIGRLGRGDRVPPVISLNGDATVNLAAGAPFDDPGATAIDDIDGDLTDFIVTTGSVNTAVIGTYQISYSVSDRAANTVTVQRVVNVGVNVGTGGGGGGSVARLSVLMLLLMLAMHRFAHAVGARTPIAINRSST